MVAAPRWRRLESKLAEFGNAVSCPAFPVRLGCNDQAVRAPLGAPTKRVLGSVTKTGSLPGVPAGDYEVLEYRTDFANRRGAIETVVLARENAGWGVVGYFIR